METTDIDRAALQLITVEFTAPFRQDEEHLQQPDKNASFCLSVSEACSDTEWRREENRAKTYGRWRSWKECERMGWGCWLSVSTITSLKKIQHGTKIVSKKRCFAAMESEGTSRWTHPCPYAFSSVASSAASVTWRWEEGEELYKDAGVIHHILKEQPTTFVLVCHGSAGKSSVGLVTKSAISSWEMKGGLLYWNINMRIFLHRPVLSIS